MKKSVAVWNYPGSNLENAKEFIRRGFDEVSWLGNTFANMTEAEDEALVELLKSTGTTFTVHYGLPDVDNAEACEAFKKAIDRCAAWQAKYGCLKHLTFDFWYDIDLSMPNLERAIKAMRGSGTTLACEDIPLNGRLLDKFTSLLTKDDKYGLLIDLGHMNIRQHTMQLNEPEDYTSAIAGLPLDVVEVHLHNNRGRKDEHMYITYGNLPLAACIEGLKRKKFDGSVTVEVVQRDWSPEEGFGFAELTRDAFFKLW